ncbi:MAG: MopE-related protein, partial [Myxococcaceae bacterium]
MGHRLQSFGIALLLTSFGACDCGAPNVKERLKPEGVPCAEDHECETGMCDALPGGDRLCIRTCNAGCLQNEICEPLATDRFACVPERAGLCEECTTDADCPYPADRCLQVAGQNVCGRDCSFDGTCPLSFQCAEAVSVDGALVTQQCVPMSGTCACTEDTDGQKVPCEQANNFGTCTGVKTCTGTAGYSACSARVPTSESCNGIDDDCDGEADEEVGAPLTCGVGECFREVSVCKEGRTQTCEPGPEAPELCDGKDNDCDGQVDDGFDLQNDLQNCGACGRVCDPPHATGQCTLGACAIGQCEPNWWDADGDASNGCEFGCSPTGAERCDGIDNDCDGRIDEDFDLLNDPGHCGSCNFICTPLHASGACNAGVCAVGNCNPGRANCNQQYADGCEIDIFGDVGHCGACGQVCDPANASGACVMGVCGGTCDPGYANCDSSWTNGCETNTSSDVNNCGACGNVCAFAHASGTCSNGSCSVSQCDPDWWDADGNPANGCEYHCVFQSAVDFPDLSFEDANCDGMDGEVGNGIFVAPLASGGSDANPGTLSQPKRSIIAALAAADAQNRRDVYIATGTYVEQVAITVRGKGIYGGYQGGTFARGNAYGVTVTGVNTPLLLDDADNTIVQLITFLGASASGSSGTAYGAFIRDSSGVTLEGLTIQAGNGSDGQSGGVAVAGNNGAEGRPGGTGCENSSGFCSWCAQPLGGAGGTS